VKKKIAALAIAASGALSSASFAAEVGSSYAEIGYGALTYKESGFTLKPSVIKGTFGVVSHEGLAFEAFAATGISDSTVRYLNVPVTLSVDSAFGVYARPFFRLGESGEVYARLGFFHGTLSVSALGYSYGSSGSDISYGVGAAVNLSKSTALTVEAMNYYDKDGIQVTSVGAGVRFNF
jgi:hypothetical protein